MNRFNVIDVTLPDADDADGERIARATRNQINEARKKADSQKHNSRTPLLGLPLYSNNGNFKGIPNSDLKRDTDEISSNLAPNIRKILEKVLSERHEKPEPQKLYSPPPDNDWLQVAPHPSVIIILGKRGSGKSALGYRLLELSRDRAKPYVVSFADLRKLLPEWIGLVNAIEEAPPHSTLLLDEAYIQYHARDTMSELGRQIGTMVNLSRQKNQTLIFIVQEARQLDINAISQADVIAFKELSEISKGFERRELRQLSDKARVAFSAISPNRRRRFAWVYSDSASYEGLKENNLPTFWKDPLSHTYASFPVKNNPPSPRHGRKNPIEVRIQRVKDLHQQGFSYGQIAKQLGISRQLAYYYLNHR